MNTEIQRVKISIKGVVQGVGFRPFIFNLAVSAGMKGYVLNSSNGLIIDVEGRDADAFAEKILSSPPVLARIKEADVVSLPAFGYETFTIKESLDHEGITLVPPDISVCDDCLNEIFDGSNRRHGYPFTNCTNCGPRFTIINGIPYDREKTTMAVFTMCPECRAEYNNPADRRFHAQPNACPACGPKLELIIKSSGFGVSEEYPVEGTIKLLKQGAVVAIKGIGGFHLCCDAENEDAVRRLRERKRKNNKPFALMSPDIETIKKFCALDDAETKTLLSFERPIVLLEKLTNDLIAPSVAPKNRRYGVMLPYTPLHYLLFSSQFPLLTSNFSALVMTSGNLAEEPIVINNDEAINKLGGIADAFLINDRDIYMRADDSVSVMFEGKPRLVRRSRGYVPMPVEMPFDMPEILAVGGELKNTFAVTKGGYAFISQHIGDLENHETMEFFEESLRNIKDIYRIDPAAVAHDLHPDYLTTRWALKSGLKKTAVQHHHAHIASCMMDNGIDESVIGAAFDGTGYGSDGNIWGGEFMIADLKDFSREGHFKYVPLPGGDAAVREPWRMAVSYIIDSFGDSYEDVLKSLGFFERCGEENIKRLTAIINKRVNTPLTSSAGRLFDAVSSMTGLCDRITFEGEAAIALEAVCDETVFDHYPVNITGRSPLIIDFSRTINAIVKDIQEGLPRQIIAARFHNTVSEAAGRVVENISERSGLRKAALSGGVFQNRFLLQRTSMDLREKGIEVLIHERVPANDGGLSLGQAAIAAKRLRSGGADA